MPSKDFFSNKRLQLIIISAFVFLLYARTISYEYIGLDDTTLIESNYKFIKNLNNIPKAFTRHVMQVDKVPGNEKDYYRPMLTLSFMLDANIAGSAKPSWYHFANVLYHLIACLLLFALLGKLKVNPVAAFLLTLLFALHPVVDQAVAWIPGRNDVLLGIYTMGSFIYLLNYIEKPSQKALLWHCLLFGCALFTKENGIVLPFLFLLYIRLVHSKFSKEHLKLLAGYAAFILPWAYLRSIAIAGSTTDNSLQVTLSNFINNLPFILQYISKAVLPFNLSVMCMIEDVNYPLAMAAIVLIGAGIYFSKNKRWGYVVFALFWFVLLLAPSFSARLVEGLEHRLYVPIIGFIILAAETDWTKKLSATQKKLWIAPVAYGIVLLIISSTRLSIFKNRFNFNISAMETSKYAVVPCVNLAGDYQVAGQFDKAIAMYKIALARDSVYGLIHPKNRVSYYSILHDNLGVIYLDRKQLPQAEEQFALAAKSGDVYAIYHLANVYARTNRNDEAAPLWKKVIALQPQQPDFKDVYLRLANYSKNKGDSAGFTHYVQEYKRMGF